MFKNNKKTILIALDYSQIDNEIVHIVKGLNTLPFLYTGYSCAGYGKRGGVYKPGEDHEVLDFPYISMVYDKNDVRWKGFHADLCSVMPFGKIESNLNDDNDIDYIGFIYRLICHYRSRHPGYTGATLKDLKRNVWEAIQHIIKKFDPTYEIKINVDMIDDRLSPVYKIDEWTNEKCWFVGDKRHKIGAPAIDDKYTEAWYVNDRLHRENGPALITKLARSNKDEYWLNGKHVKKEEVIHGPYIPRPKTSWWELFKRST